MPNHAKMRYVRVILRTCCREPVSYACLLYFAPRRGTRDCPRHAAEALPAMLLHQWTDRPRPFDSHAVEFTDMECCNLDSIMISSPDRMLYEYSCFVGNFISSGPGNSWWKKKIDILKYVYLSYNWFLKEYVIYLCVSKFLIDIEQPHFRCRKTG